MEFSRGDENKIPVIADRLQLETGSSHQRGQASNGEVGYGDSQQVYRGLDIGTAT